MVNKQLKILTLKRKKFPTNKDILDCWTVDDEIDGCLETSVNNWYSTLRKIPQERRSQAGNLKSLYDWPQITQE
jgi:hypothetical protein